MPVADVWVHDVRELAAGGHLDRYRALLSRDERERLGAFRHEADRLAYLAAHGLARMALSRRSPGIAPDAWRFRATAYGRPEVDLPTHQDRPRFNISHTRLTVACVVTDDVECGIDVEHTDGAADIELLARGVLTAEERASLDPLDTARRRAGFFRYWTLKEAYVKARGMGMSLPLDRYGFDLTGEAVGLRPDPSLDDPAAAEGWLFVQWWHASTTVAAVALRPRTDDHTTARHRRPP